jgi:hypothetical protein
VVVPQFVNWGRSCGSNEDAACETSKFYSTTWNSQQYAYLAVDGIITDQTTGNLQQSENDGETLCTHTYYWWQVDLGVEQEIDQVTIYGSKGGQWMAS